MLLDRGAKRVDFTPRATTIAVLRGVPRPAGIGPTSERTGPIEARTYRLTNVRLVAVRRTASYDTLLLVRGPKPTDWLVVAFPDTHSCLPVAGLHGGDIHSATDGLNADCGPSIPSDRWQPLTGTATLTGVGFFEPAHAAPPPWLAPNGLTLHPALSFRAQGCEQVGFSP